MLFGYEKLSSGVLVLEYFLCGLFSKPLSNNGIISMINNYIDLTENCNCKVLFYIKLISIILVNQVQQPREI